MSYLNDSYHPLLSPNQISLLGKLVCKNSYVYLSCRLFIEDNSAKMFIQRLEVGDCMGCGVNSENEQSKKVFFTRNGSTVSSNGMQMTLSW